MGVFVRNLRTGAVSCAVQVASMFSWLEKFIVHRDGEVVVRDGSCGVVLSEMARLVKLDVVEQASYHGFGCLDTKARVRNGAVVGAAILELNARIGASHLTFMMPAFRLMLRAFSECVERTRGGMQQVAARSVALADISF